MENNNDNLIKDINNIEKPSNSKLRENLKGAWDLVKFAVLALAIVIPVRVFVAQPFVVSGDSMFPTFHNGEYLIVDELSYLLEKGPHRGDVVIFKYPNDPSRYFIKRVIGLPNEKINIKDGVITIINKDNPNGFTLNEPYVNGDFKVTDSYITNDKEYFVMGDNRNRSSDSRSWGNLPHKLVVGRAYLRLLPTKSIGYLPGEYKNNK